MSTCFTSGCSGGAGGCLGLGGGVNQIGSEVLIVSFYSAVHKKCIAGAHRAPPTAANPKLYGRSMTAQTLAAANSPRQTRLHSKRSGPDRKSKHPSSPARSLSAAPTHPLLCRSFDRTSSAQATLAGGLCRPGTERTGRTIHLEKTRRRV